MQRLILCVSEDLIRSGENAGLTLESICPRWAQADFTLEWVPTFGGVLALLAAINLPRRQLARRWLLSMNSKNRSKGTISMSYPFLKASSVNRF